LVDSGISPHLLANSTKLTSRVDFFRKWANRLELSFILLDLVERRKFAVIKSVSLWIDLVMIHLNGLWLFVVELKFVELDVEVAEVFLIIFLVLFLFVFKNELFDFFN
jgi:hypothetical protein